jgi:type II secretory pathway component PulJ
MIIAAIILSSLALLAASFDAVMTAKERKRNQEQKTDLIEFVNFSLDRMEKSLEERIKKLEDGAMPDYEAAKAAAQAVNDFNAGISGILGFDPHEALKKQRNETTGGERE